jgi:hypothetical protein
MVSDSGGKRRAPDDDDLIAPIGKQPTGAYGLRHGRPVVGQTGQVVGLSFLPSSTDGDPATAIVRQLLALSERLCSAGWFPIWVDGAGDTVRSGGTSLAAFDFFDQLRTHPAFPTGRPITLLPAVGGRISPSFVTTGAMTVGGDVLAPTGFAVAVCSADNPGRADLASLDRPPDSASVPVTVTPVPWRYGTTFVRYSPDGRSFPLHPRLDESLKMLGGTHPTGDRRALARHLSAVAVAETRDDGLLGPDFFGTRIPPPSPPWSARLRQADLATGQVAAFLAALDLMRPGQPEQAALRVERIPSRPGVRTVTGGYEIPPVAYSIWLGGPLTDETTATREVRSNIAQWRERLADPEFTVVLLTDVPRAAFAAFHAGGGTPQIVEMAQWAGRHRITVVHVDEIFHAAEPMESDRFFRLESTKQHGRGYAAASDILRLEVLRRFGGVYADGDHVIADATAMWQGLDRSGFTVFSPAPGSFGNSGIVAGRKHPFLTQYLTVLRRNYERSQPDLLDDAWQSTSRVDNERVIGASGMRARRYSVLRRTGPENLAIVARGLGIHPGDLPRLTGLSASSATSWVPRGPLAAQRRIGAGEVLPVLERVVATLIRGLYNRRGDLHLTEVAPVVNGLPDPATAWAAATDFILRQPRLMRRLRTVTDRAMVFGPRGLRRVDVVDLPADVALRLGLNEPGPDADPEGEWRLGELVRPVAGPQPLTGWLYAGDWVMSRAIFDAHRDELSSTESRAVLREMLRRSAGDESLRTHEALIELASHQRTGIAYDYLTAPDLRRRAEWFRRLDADAQVNGLLLRLVDSRGEADPEHPELAVERLVLSALAADSVGVRRTAERHRRLLVDCDRPGWTQVLESLRRTVPERAELIEAAAVELLTCAR